MHLTKQMLMHSYLLVNNYNMSDITTFCTYLNVMWYSNETIRTYKSSLIYFLLRLLENNKQLDYDSIKSYRNDMLFYVSNNTVYKYISVISSYIHYRNVIHNDYSLRKERIDYPKYQHNNWYNFYNQSNNFTSVM